MGERWAWRDWVLPGYPGGSLQHIQDPSWCCSPAHSSSFPSLLMQHLGFCASSCPNLPGCHLCLKKSTCSLKLANVAHRFLMNVNVILSGSHLKDSGKGFPLVPRVGKGTVKDFHSVSFSLKYVWNYHISTCRRQFPSKYSQLGRRRNSSSLSTFWLWLHF